MKRMVFAAACALAVVGCGDNGGTGGSTKGTVTLKPSMQYDCKDGTRIVQYDDAGNWVREKADGTDVAQGGKDKFYAELDACKGK